MRVRTEQITVYTFTNDEMWQLIHTGMWKYINERLQANERIEIDRS